jgi:hypothetical protein
MAPEQRRGEASDVRADIYSLAVIAYEMLAGAPPFPAAWRGDEPTERPRALYRRVPDLPRGVSAAVDAALARDPAARPPSVAAFVAALHAGRETTARLIRRSLALCVDHFWLFSRRCAAVTVPSIVAFAVAVAVSALARAGRADPRAGLLAMRCASFVTILSVLAQPPVVGALVIPVADLSAGRAPRPAPTAGERWRAVARALPSSLVTGLLVAAGVWGGGLFVDSLIAATKWSALGAARDSVRIALASALIVPFLFCGEAVAVEGAGGLAPLRRSVALVRSMVGPALGITVYYSVLRNLLAQLGVVLLRIALPREAAAVDGVLVKDLLDETLAALFVPLLEVPSALLYLRAREAEGRPFGASDAGPA